MNAQSTVLVVDDDAPGRTMLSLSLRQEGFRVLTAGSGEEALTALKNGRCDWLVTDAKMEPMDGFILAQQAKKIQPDLRVVMISALCTESDIQGHPIEKFFSKPVPVEGLLDWISPGGPQG